MPDPFFIEDIPEEQFPDHLRGKVILADGSEKRRLLMIIGLILGCFLAIGSWVYFYLTRPTPEEVFQEKLRSEFSILSMENEITRVLNNPASSIEEIKQSLSLALFIAESTLRRQSTYESFYIPSRYRSIVYLLEGLLILFVERGLDSENLNHANFYNDVMNRLSILNLEYYEDGGYKMTALIPDMAKKLELQRERAFLDPSKELDRPLIEEIEKQLGDLEAQESSTPVSAALSLGKWYRYHNDLPMAKRCFEIGRRYVEGYEKEGEYFKGYAIDQTKKRWQHYFFCLKHLVEMAFQEKKYREARSYIMRMFNVPHSLVSIVHSSNINDQIQTTREKLISLEKDIQLLEKVIASPEILSRFPLLDYDDERTIDWLQLTTNLLNRGELKEESFYLILWNALSPQIQHYLERKGPKYNLHETIKKEMTEIINGFIQSPIFFKKLKISQKQLSSKGLQLLQFDSQRELFPEEYQFLNREMIEIDSNVAISSPFLLTDGRRLSHALLPEQTANLIEVYHQILLLSPNDHQIKNRIRQINSEQYHPSFLDFKNATDSVTVHYEALISDKEMQFDELRQQLQLIHKELLYLETQDRIDPGKLAELHDRQMIIQKQLPLLAFEQKHLSMELKRIQSRFDVNTSQFQELIDSTKQEKKSLEEYEKQLFQEHAKDEETLISKIKRSIALREKYLEFLNQVDGSELNQKIEEIEKKSAPLQKQITELREKIKESAGNQREELENKLLSLEKQLFLLTKDSEQLFSGLEEVIGEIVREEEKVWLLQERQKQVLGEIQEIIGSEEKKGKIQEYLEKRRKYLLNDADEMLHRPDYNEQIQEINEKLIRGQSRLEVLLQEQLLLANEFNVLSGIEDAYLFPKAIFSPLQEQLQKQKTVMTEYQKFFHEKLLFNDIYIQQKTLLDHFRLMKENLDEEGLTEEKIRNLGRYMQVIIRVEQQLRNNQKKLKAMQQGKEFTVNSQIPYGYHLDLLEMYQMESEMGLDINLYRQVFDQHAHLLSELKSSLKDKEVLQKRLKEAEKSGNQSQQNYFTMHVHSAEQLILSLSDKLMKTNRQLFQINVEYEKKLEKVVEYQEKILPQIESIERQAHQLFDQMENYSSQMQSFSLQIIQFNSIVQKVREKLHLGDLKAISQSKEEQLSRIAQLRTNLDSLVREGYYKSVAIWLMGRSFYYQSRLPDYESLIESQKISDVMKHSENRMGKSFSDEYDPLWVYSKEMFYQKQEEDDNYADYLSWVDFSEQSAIHLLSHILPKYLFVVREGNNPLGTLDSIAALISDGYFLSGTISMQRAHKQFIDSDMAMESNDLAKQEWSKASELFTKLIEFSEPLTGQNYAVLQREALFSPDFPKKQILFVDKTNEARLWKGISFLLQREYGKAANEFHEILKKELGDDFRNWFDEMDGPPLGQIRDISLLQQQYDSYIHPQYLSQIISDPLLQEVIYRLSQTYQSLAQSLYYQAKTSRQQSEKGKETWQHYAKKSISYYSQLLMLDSNQQFYRAALLQRSKLYSLFQLWNLAKQDLTTLLELAFDSKKVLSALPLTIKGDDPQELAPSRATVAFQLGEVASHANDPYTAQEAFALATRGDSDDRQAIEAKIAYAQSFMRTGQWVTALHLLNELLKEREEVDHWQQHWYPPTLWIQKGLSQKALFDFSGAHYSFKRVFSAAPFQLLDRSGELSLASRQGMTVLEMDYRDAIHPLALACYQMGETLFLQKKYTKAREYFSRSMILFRILPWQADPQLKEQSYRHYFRYKSFHLLASRWGKIKSDLNDYLFSLFASYRKEIRLDQLLVSSFQFDSTNQLIGTTLGQIEKEREQIRDWLDRLSKRREKEYGSLPEIVEKKKMRAKQDHERIQEGNAIVEYDMLVSLRGIILKNQYHSGRELLMHLEKMLPFNSVQYKLLNECLLDYIHVLALTEEDRLKMDWENSNIENLLRIDGAEERLDFSRFFILDWIENKMRGFAFDDVFVPLSQQAQIIEEMDLYRMALLLLLGDRQSYQTAVEMADEYIEKNSRYPSQVLSLPHFFQLVKMASFFAKEQKDWLAVQRYSELLLHPDFQGDMVLSFDQEQRDQVTVNLAEALLTEGKKVFDLASVVTDREEQREYEQRGETVVEQGKELLRTFLSTSHDHALFPTLRVYAHRLLEEAA